MSFKRRVLSAFTKVGLLERGRTIGIEVKAVMTVDQLRDLLAGSKRARLDLIVTADLGREALKAICDACGLETTGRDKQLLVERILAAGGGGGAGADHGDDDAKAANESATAHAPAVESTVKKSKASANGNNDGGAVGTAEAPAQAWLGFPQLDLPVVPAGGAPPPRRAASAPVPAPVSSPPAGREYDVTLEVQPRKPRLAWQGMARKEVAVAVPTQVVEIVRPGRAIERGRELALDARQVIARDVTSVPPNRLIWTNDNLVALQTLIDEKDPVTRDYPPARQARSWTGGGCGTVTMCVTPTSTSTCLASSLRGRSAASNST